MVDPDRKINRLTDDLLDFLNECEEEFDGRFSEEEPEFVLFCNKPLMGPPVMKNFNSSKQYGRRGGGGGGSYRGRGPYGGFRRGGMDNNYQRNNYERRGGRDGHGQGYGPDRDYHHRRYERNQPYRRRDNRDRY